jgi:hypothetical protein
MPMCSSGGTRPRAATAERCVRRRWSLRLLLACNSGRGALLARGLQRSSCPCLRAATMELYERPGEEMTGRKRIEPVHH